MTCLVLVLKLFEILARVIFFMPLLTVFIQGCWVCTITSSNVGLKPNPIEIGRFAFDVDPRILNLQVNINLAFVFDLSRHFPSFYLFIATISTITTFVFISRMTLMCMLDSIFKIHSITIFSYNKIFFTWLNVTLVFTF